MRVIYTSKGMSKKFWGARYTLGARYLSKNTVIILSILMFFIRHRYLLHHKPPNCNHVRVIKTCVIHVVTS